MGVASFYSDRPVMTETVTIWLDSLNDIDHDLVHMALRKWFNDPKATRPPTPGQIREIIFPQMNERNEAVEAASRIVAAAPKFGHQGKSNREAARAYVGELGWMAVERIGGWQYLCENLGTKVLPLTVAQAQLRDACEAIAKRAKAGLAELPPSLPKIELEESKSAVRMIEQKSGVEGLVKEVAPPEPKEGE